jgi:hypothetical protein
MPSIIPHRTDGDCGRPGFISGRPVYTAVRASSGPGRMIRLRIGDDDTCKLDVVLGQAHYLMTENVT